MASTSRWAGFKGQNPGWRQARVLVRVVEGKSYGCSQKNGNNEMLGPGGLRFPLSARHSMLGSYVRHQSSSNLKVMWLQDTVTSYLGKTSISQQIVPPRRISICASSIYVRWWPAPSF